MSFRVSLTADLSSVDGSKHADLGSKSIGTVAQMNDEVDAVEEALKLLRTADLSAAQPLRGSGLLRFHLSVYDGVKFVAWRDGGHVVGHDGLRIVESLVEGVLTKRGWSKS